MNKIKFWLFKEVANHEFLRQELTNTKYRTLCNFSINARQLDDSMMFIKPVYKLQFHAQDVLDPKNISLDRIFTTFGKFFIPNSTCFF